MKASQEIICIIILNGVYGLFPHPWKWGLLSVSPSLEINCGSAFFPLSMRSLVNAYRIFQLSKRTYDNDYMYPSFFRLYRSSIYFLF